LISPPGGPTNDFLARWRAHAQAIVVIRAHGCVADGWASPRLRELVRPGGELLVIEGELPASFRLRSQRLTVRIDSRPVTTADLRTGPFEIRVPLPRTSAPLIEVEVLADRHRVPLGQLARGRPHRLAYRLYRLEVLR
jgi:hypothetical protein